MKWNRICTIGEGHISEDKKQGLSDYEKQGLSKKETIRYLLQGVGIAAFFAYMFYRSVPAFFLLLGILPFYLKAKTKDVVKKRKESMSFQFQELLNSLLGSLQAGYSVENAFVRAYDDVKLVYGDGAILSKELILIRQALRNNKNLEDILMDLGERSHVPEIMDFAEIFSVAKRSGGNLPSIIRSTAEVITIRMEVKRKIATMISSKQMEQNIMNVVPFAILLYINSTSPGFFDSLYHNPVGVILMTAMLAVYLAAYVLAKKIINVEMK